MYIPQITCTESVINFVLKFHTNSNTVEAVAILVIAVTKAGTEALGNRFISVIN